MSLDVFKALHATFANFAANDFLILPSLDSVACMLMDGAELTDLELLDLRREDEEEEEEGTVISETVEDWHCCMVVVSERTQASLKHVSNCSLWGGGSIKCSRMETLSYVLLQTTNLFLLV